MEIRLAQNGDIKYLYSLWNQAFEDDENTIDLFFKNSFSLSNTVVALDNKKLVSMAFLLPEKIVVNNSKYNANYLYALATDREYRKRGIMAKVIEYITELSIDRNIDYLFLVPASEKLFDYYFDNGFVNAFCQKKLTINKSTLQKIASGCQTHEASFNSTQYRNLKSDNILVKNNNQLEKSFVDWRENELELAYDYFNLGNGEAISTECGSCFIEHTNDGDKIFDLNCDENRICDMIGAVLNHIISDKVELYLSKNYALIGDNQEFYNCGMIKKLKPNLDNLENTFMGITLQ